MTNISLVSLAVAVFLVSSNMAATATRPPAVILAGPIARSKPDTMAKSKKELGKITAQPLSIREWGYCRGGWHLYNDYCYAWSHTELTKNWFFAQIICRANGGHLVSVLDKDEAKVLRGITMCQNEYWLGLVNTEYSDGLFLKKEGWTWWDQKNYSNYTNLHINNIVGLDCVFAHTDGHWSNSYCSNIHRQFVCKRPAKVADKYVDQIDLSASPFDEPQPTGDKWPWVPPTTPAYTTETTISMTPRPTEDPMETTPVPRHKFCPDGWVAFNWHCYWFSNTSVNYFHAQLHCASMYSHVVTIKNNFEQGFLQAVNGCDNGFWVGLERASPCLSTNGGGNCWEWTDLSNGEYVNWANKNPTASDVECTTSKGYWNNEVRCSDKQRFICKKKMFP